ncbi:MAG: hypothetical protein AMS15_02120 [Planctomycetes bacterium DG_23]|nr:MAG: hypothetical protein AMS15_02120 [Planctomycetes bacterium DG_23]
MSEVLALTVGGWLSRGWRTFKDNPKPVIGAAVIMSAYSLVLTLIGLLVRKSFVLLPIQFIITPVLTVGWCFLCLRVVRGDNARVSDLFAAFSRFGRAWLTFFLFFLIVLGGFFLLVVPGVIWGLKYSLSVYAVMDRDLSARECIRFSGKITKGYKGRLFGASLIALLLGLMAMPFSFGLQRLGEDLGLTLIVIGIVPYLVHLLVIVPWMGATYAAAYDNLAYGQETGGSTKTSAGPG